MPNDTMVHGGVTYNVWYVDPTGSNGDGLAPGTAFNVLPAPASIPESACYIIRRNAVPVIMSFANATSATKYLMILGMPLPTDELYQEVPTAAKTAWDGDSSSVLWAGIRLSTDNSMYRSNNYQFVMDRVHIFRNTGVNSDTAYNFNFTTGCSRWTSHIKFNNCKFSTLGYDMSVPGYNTMIPNNYEGGYIYVDSNADANGCSTFTFTNNILNHGGNNGSWQNSIAILNARYVNISNNIFHQCGSQTWVGVIYVGVPTNNYAYENFESFIFDNNTLTLWVNGSTAYSGQFGSFLYAVKANYVSFRNFTCTDSSTVLGGSGNRPSRIMFYNPLVKLDGLRSFDIKNINVTITQWSEINSDNGAIYSMQFNSFTDTARLAGGCVLCFAGTPGGSMEGYVRNISDIAINLPDTPTVLPNVDTPNWGMFNGHQSYYTQFAALYVNFQYGSAQPVGTSWAANDIQYPYVNSAKPVVKLTNVVVNNWRGKAMFLAGVAGVFGDIKGQVVLVGESTVTINSISTWFPGAALFLSPSYTYGGCIAQVGTITVNKSNATYPYVAQLAVAFGTDNGGVGTPYSPRCNMVYVGSSNAPTASNVGSGTASANREYPNRFACICANELTTGNYMMRTLNYVVNTWSTYRTGGASASLKMYQNACSSWTDWMFLGQDPYSAMVVTPSTTGKKYLRMYLAHKSYGDPQNYFNNIQFIVKYKNLSGNGSYDYRYSMTEGIWKTDAVSTWNGDTGLTQLVCQIPIDIQTLDPIDVKMGFNWYSAAGYLYLDPIPVIADTLI